jgi:hypothetical protein
LPVCAAVAFIGAEATAEPRVGSTFSHRSVSPARRREIASRQCLAVPIEYYGTDLGFSYGHQGQVRFLFGDTIANDKGEPIQASTAKALRTT